MNQHSSEHGSERRAALWHVRVALEDIPEGGQHFTLAADAQVRAAIAQTAGLREVPRLEADFKVTREVTRHGAEGVHVVGQVSASVGQTCVVTLEPLLNEVTEDVDLLFVPQSADVDRDEIDAGPKELKWDDPEPLTGGVVDLGALAAEFLILGLDPYPRRPDAAFDPPQDSKSQANPFDALAGWAKGRDDT
jgi:Large ribosomal RNA subunit accumulation protein YceD